jgi:hypothetical protein
MIKQKNNYMILKLLVLENTVNRLQEMIEGLEKRIETLENVHEKNTNCNFSPPLINILPLPTPENTDIKDFNTLNKITSYDLMTLE